MLDRGQLRPERGEFVHQALLFAAGLRPDELQLDEAIAAGKGQHRVEHAGNRLERRGADGNGHRHREPRHHRQAAMLEQHAEAESGIEQQRVEPAQAVHVMPGLFVFLDAAEAD